MEKVIYSSWAKIIPSLCVATLVSQGALAQSTPAAPPLIPLGSVPLRGVEGRLDHLTADVASQRLFVAALENHSVEVIDLQHRRRVHQLTGIREPQGLAFVPEARRLLVCSRGDGTLRSFDAKTFAEGPWIDLGRNADNVRFDPASSTAFVGSGEEPGPGLLSALDLTSLLPAAEGGKPAPARSKADLLPDRPRQAEVRAEVTLPAHPESFQIDSARHRALVNVPDDHQIAVVNVSSNALTLRARWPVTPAEKNFPMTLDAAGSRVYVACRLPPCLLAYDAATGQLLSKQPCVGDADDLYCDAQTGNIYVIGGEGYVDVFHTADPGGKLSRVQQIPTAPRARTGLLIPDLHLLAVAVPHTTNGPAAVLLFQTKP